MKILIILLILIYVNSQIVITSSLLTTNITTCTSACCKNGQCSNIPDYMCIDGLQGIGTICTNTTCNYQATVQPFWKCSDIVNGVVTAFIMVFNSNNFNVIFNSTTDPDNCFTGLYCYRGQPQIYPPGTTTFSIEYNTTEGNLNFTLAYPTQNVQTTITIFNQSTCTAACCNLTYCSTLNRPTCASIPSVTFNNLFTNCNGSNYCGIPQPLNMTNCANTTNLAINKVCSINNIGCTQNFDNGTVISSIVVCNPNNETITIYYGPNNNITNSITNGSQLQIFPAFMCEVQNIISMSTVPSNWTLSIYVTIGIPYGSFDYYDNPSFKYLNNINSSCLQ